MAEGTCSVEGCGQLRQRRGWCSAHYTRWRKTGDPLAGGQLKTRRYESGATCLVDDCGGRPAAWGWCSGHYRRWRTHRDVLADVPLRKARPANPDGKCQADGCLRETRLRWCAEHKMPTTKVCTVETCGKPAKGRDLCAAHQTRLHRYGDVLAGVPFQRTNTLAGQCIEPGCDRKRHARERCSTHYDKYRLTGQLGLQPTPTPDEVERRAETRRRYQRDFKAAEYARDPAAALAKKKEWRLANPETVRLMWSSKQRRRQAARRLPFTVEQLAAKMSYWGNRCWMCQGPAKTVDHVKPIAEGGWHALMNLRPACLPCNARKGGRWPLSPTALT